MGGGCRAVPSSLYVAIIRSVNHTQRPYGDDKFAWFPVQTRISQRCNINLDKIQHTTGVAEPKLSTSNLKPASLCIGVLSRPPALMAQTGFVTLGEMSTAQSLKPFDLVR